MPAPRKTTANEGASPTEVGEKFVTQRIVPVDPRTFTALLEQLQEGYVATVAATAGCSMEVVGRDFFGFDAWLIRPPSAIGAGEETSVLVQMKNTTTIKPDPAKGTFSYQFKERKYFDALAGKRKNTKAIGLIMVSPPEQALWTISEHDFLAVRHCCYWVDLEGYEVGAAVQQPSVKIPTANVFNAAALSAIMERLERGEAM
jgi:hypothetical protein